jgi:rhamnosyltransferase subunit B
MAVGLGLRARGHRVTIATSEIYRSKIEGEGLRFHPVRPDLAPLVNDPGLMSRAYHPRTGTEFIIRRIFLPRLDESYEDPLAVARDADLLVGHPIAYATPLIAEKLGKPWISVALSPIAMLSAWDPPVLSGVPWLTRFRACGPGFWRLFWRIARRASRDWGAPINRLRQGSGSRSRGIRYSICSRPGARRHGFRR